MFAPGGHSPGDPALKKVNGGFFTKRRQIEGFCLVSTDEGLSREKGKRGSPELARSKKGRSDLKGL